MSNSLEIKMTIKFPRNLMQRFMDLFNKKLRDAESRINEKLLHDAREIHRYKHDTRNLRNATKIKGKVTDPKGLLLYVDLNKADYGEYIIKGQRSWKGDPFLDQAMEKNAEYIQEQIQTAVNGATIEFNRK